MNLRHWWKTTLCRVSGHAWLPWRRIGFDPRFGVAYRRMCQRCMAFEVEHRDEVVSPPSGVPIAAHLRGPLEGWWNDVIDKHHGHEPDYLGPDVPPLDW